MSAALEILTEVRRRGGDIKLIAPDRLKVLAPTALLPELVEKVRAVKPALLVALAEPKLPAEWRARHAEARAYWRAFHPTAEAADLAWGEMQCRWHRLHGEPVEAGLCTGCGLPLGEGEVLRLGDGTAVHFGTFDCLFRYGRRWRATATAALVAMGLTPPLADYE